MIREYSIVLSYICKIFHTFLRENEALRLWSISERLVSGAIDISPKSLIGLVDQNP